jgi:hypothetical protein
MGKMKVCSECNKSVETEDHRWCLVKLFKENKIQSLEDWQKMCKEVARRVKIRVRV